MSITIIIKDGKPRGKTRSSIDRELQDAGWGTTFAREGDADKCEFVERKLKKQLGVDDGIVNASVLNRIGKKR
jgi:hypothetical protein